MLKKNDGYVMIYVMIVMLILGLVAGNALAAASHNATSEVNAVRQMRERYTAEGQLNRMIAKLEAETGNFFELPADDTELGIVTDVSQMKTVSENALKDSINIKKTAYILEEHEGNRVIIVFPISVTEGSTTITATIQALFSFDKKLSIGDGPTSYVLKTISCSIESFEVTQS